ncbi:putative L-type lectin-domain containing receptor kinase V.3 [Diplodia seriata]|uniref:Putative L-type lectin-domain containing receptor kinase V.3 n=1 Tax=Diplodia seriata TaxID=420778 RepID=A0A1S8B8X3_9PEZI|nr:putative L-type lectin-domain containing receptor kinase V.3 [Diplodia seriata]
MEVELWRDGDSACDTLASLPNDFRNIEEEGPSNGAISRRGTLHVNPDSKYRRFSDQLSFRTARSSISAARGSAMMSFRSSMAFSFITAQSNPSKLSLATRSAASTPAARKENHWIQILKRRGLLPPDSLEQNWSGKGQHVEFTNVKKVPLEPEGRDLSAMVDVVTCRRIRLARKRIFFRDKLSREEAADEVSHLQRLNHAHIIRVIGTYVLPAARSVNILLYPVAEYNLETFLDEIWGAELSADITWTAAQLFSKASPLSPFQLSALSSLSSFFTCLTNTVAHLHGAAAYVIKHMDIKPTNILVRDMHASSALPHPTRFKAYLSDFGIARSYDSAAAADTASRTAFTRTWAAPEVVANAYADDDDDARDVRRGLPADVFSLGAVFAEMTCALAGSWHLAELRRARERNIDGDRSFQGNRAAVVGLLEILDDLRGFQSGGGKADVADREMFFVFPIPLCVRMMSLDPDERPEAKEVVGELRRLRGWGKGLPDDSCCAGVADALEPAL